MNKQSSSNKIDIVHDTQNACFYYQMDSSRAELLYQLEANRVDFYRTFVPPEARGSGVAYKLVSAGLAWAEQQGLEIHASCWYVAKVIQRKESSVKSETV